MKRSSVLCIIALLLSVCSVSESQSSAADSVAGNAKISLAIAAKQNTFKVGETILLNIAVKNISTDNYCENHFLETGEAELNGYDVDVRGSDGKIYPSIPISRDRWRRSRGKLCIKPGEILKELLSVNQIADLSGPGVYQIQVDHMDGGHIHARSNSITVSVTP
jgi:hypothetical protein